MDHVNRGYETLNTLEISIAKHLAKVRHQENIDKGIKDRQIGSQDPVLAFTHAIAAEISFCKRANCYPDLSNSVRKGGPDCIYYECTVDVKHTTYENNTHLVVPPHKNDEDRKVEFYVLMVGTELGKYRFAGFIHSKYIVIPERLKDWFGHGECYAMPETELN